MSGTHSTLAPSAAHRWMECPASVVLEQIAGDNTSFYAAEGTCAHWLASQMLIEDDFIIPVGETHHFDGHNILITREMQDYVEDYVKLVREYAEGGILLVDQKVDFSGYVGTEGQTGTADAIIIKNRKVIQIDLKYGMGVKVSAIENPQLLLYGLGAYGVADLIEEIEDVVLVIHQPRLNHVSEYHLTVAELLAFADKAEQAARRVDEALVLYQVSHELPPVDSGLYRPGEEQCRFCSAKAICPALREEVMLAVSGSVSTPAKPEEFAAMLGLDVGPDTGENLLAILASKMGMVEDWLKAVRAEVEKRLLAGKRVPGFKLVEGKLGNRAWTNALEVETFMKGTLKLKAADIYDEPSVSSPTTLEKRLKKTQPDKWTKLQPFIHRAPGKPSVAPDTDTRPELADGIAERFRAATTQNGE